MLLALFRVDLCLQSGDVVVRHRGADCVDHTRGSVEEQHERRDVRTTTRWATRLTASLLSSLLNRVPGEGWVMIGCDAMISDGLLLRFESRIVRQSTVAPYVLLRLRMMLTSRERAQPEGSTAGPTPDRHCTAAASSTHQSHLKVRALQLGACGGEPIEFVTAFHSGAASDSIAAAAADSAAPTRGKADAARPALDLHRPSKVQPRVQQAPLSPGRLSDTRGGDHTSPRVHPLSSFLIAPSR